MFEYQGVKIHWLGHDGFRITNSKVVYVDPYQLKERGRADLVLISHDHDDHLSEEDLRKVVTPETSIIASVNCRANLEKAKTGLRFKSITYVRPGDEVTVSGIRVRAVPAYNINKFRSPGKVFHPKEYAGVGFVTTINGVHIYHAGDTDAIAEMKDLDLDIALVPVSGTYVMTAEEAVHAVTMMKTKVAIPMHYGAIVGGKADAERFRALVKACAVNILDQE